MELQRELLQNQHMDPVIISKNDRINKHTQSTHAEYEDISHYLFNSFSTMENPK